MKWSYKRRFYSEHQSIISSHRLSCRRIVLDHRRQSTDRTCTRSHSHVSLHDAGRGVTAGILCSNLRETHFHTLFLIHKHTNRPIASTKNHAMIAPSSTRPCPASAMHSGIRMIRPNSSQRVIIRLRVRNALKACSRAY